jgi:hypothetical protein
MGLITVRLKPDTTYDIPRSFVVSTVERIVIVRSVRL